MRNQDAGTSSLTDRIRREFENTPLNTIGAVCGAASLLIGFFSAVPLGLSPSLPTGSIVAAMIVQCSALAFVVAHILGRIINSLRWSFIPSYLIGSLIFGFLANATYYGWVGVPNVQGDPADNFAAFFGVLLVGFKLAIFWEINRPVGPSHRPAESPTPRAIWITLLSGAAIETLLIGLHWIG